jgi:hypothetical protein
MSKKSILAETLLEVQEVKAAIEKNANHVLKSTLKEELEDIIKKGIGNDSEEDEDNMDVNPDSTDGMDMDEPSFGSDEEGMTDEPGVGDVPADELPGDEVIDLTDKSDEEVLKTFELMEPTDEIEIVRTQDGIEIKFNTSSEDEEDDSETGMDFGSDEEGSEDETEMDESTEDDDVKEETEDEGVMYEIEIDEADDEDDSMNEVEDDTEDKEDEKVDEVKTTSHIKQYRDRGVRPQGQGEDLHEKLVNTRKKLNTVVVENKQLKEELQAFKNLKSTFQVNEKEYKDAIKLLKGKLQEVALFTSNLTYAVKLMTENTTTKDEKFQILSTLDKAKTIDESKQLATTLEESFKNKKSASAAKIIEERVLDKTGFSGASSINESQVYKNPQIDRMKELISRIK